MSSSLISRFDTAQTPERTSSGRKRSGSHSHSPGASPRNSSASNPTKSTTEDDSTTLTSLISSFRAYLLLGDSEEVQVFGSDLNEKNLMELLRASGPGEKRETKYLTLNKDRQEGTVVIVGGSVAGVLVAKALAKLKKFSIILVDSSVRSCIEVSLSLMVLLMRLGRV